MSHAPALQDRIAFLQIDNSIKSVLDDYQDDLQQVLPEILQDFYVHISQWPELKLMFRDQARMDYARNAQEKHWLRLFKADFDEDYVQSVRKIGLVHSRIGLEPTWYLGAYGFTLSRLYAHAVRKYSNRFAPAKAQEKTAALLRALNQCVMIDMDMAITVYLDENKRSYNDRLTQLAETFENNIGSVVQAITDSSGSLGRNADMLASTATRTSTNSTTVAAAAEEASTNVETVSSSAEQMSASITQMASMTQDVMSASSTAVNESEKTAQIVSELREAITTVGDITSMITGIAEQTNLLALNATIEAARAGEAGKGFSVVASEVKSLANETARATDDIRLQLQNILEKSQAAVQSIRETTGTIQRVNTLAESATGAMNEQKLVVTEIARNVAEASIGTRSITSSIADISHGADETRDVAENVLQAIQNLKQQSDRLQDSVQDFMTNLQSAA